MAQLAVATLPSLGDSSVAEVSVALFKKWGLGHDKKRSDGVLILMVPGKPGQRKTSVEVGYGLEGVLPDGKVGAMLREHSSPLIKQDRYGPAALALATAIVGVLEADAASGCAPLRPLALFSGILFAVRPACVLALLSITVALPVRAGAEKTGALVVAVDPGHGGRFPLDGAHGVRGLIEKVIALQVAQRLKTVLEAAGATVVLTREEDVEVSLAQRAQTANEANADLFVSVHCNSMATVTDRRVTKGVETYFLSPDPTDAEARLLAELENGGPDALPMPKTTDKVQGLLADLALGQARNDSMELAATVHRQIIRRTGATSRGVRQAPFLVLSGVKMPAILVEIGFISHPQEGRALSKDKAQQRIAEAIASGVQDFADKVLARRLFPPTAEEKAARAAEQMARQQAFKLAANAKAVAEAKALAEPVKPPESQAGPVPEAQTP